ncbi:hypothetical protein PR048_002781 [Dryococelus australis]|uniref:Uncharacterized protein n=1 Tax=Dryococelus australis TaxID=614101 RepID=A0ABQ9IL52_9NEOP|nr:hypothetical protein PR048_002781 [Dryococelus australis]
MWESCRTMPLVGGFSRESPIFPALSFRRCSVLTSLHPHRLSRKYTSDVTRRQRPYVREDGRSVGGQLAGCRRAGLPEFRLWGSPEQCSGTPGAGQLPLQRETRSSQYSNRATVSERFNLLTSTRRSSFNPRPGHSGFAYAGIVPDDSVGQWVFSGISRFPRPFTSVLLHTHLNHPFGSQDVDREPCGGVVVRLLASHIDEPGSIPDGVSPEFLHVEIMPGDVAGPRVFSGISRFPRPLIRALLHTHLASPSSAVNTSMLRAAQISSSTDKQTNKQILQICVHCHDGL